MGLLQECPQCHKRYSLKRKACRCGFKFDKASGKVYWIEFYLDGRRKRERIGPNKAAASQRLREILNNRTEGRYIDKAKNINVTFDEIARWYRELPQIKAKRSYDRDLLSIRTLSRFFSGKKVSEMTLNFVETYRQKRLTEKSCRKHLTRPATVNREIACLRHMLNLAEQESIIDKVPFKGLKQLKEDNIRDRVLKHEEFEKLLSCCPAHTAAIVKMGYYTAMRKSEILKLKWDRIDLRNGFIRLKGEDTKTGERRTIPIHPEIMDLLKSIPRNIHGWVFTLNGKPIKDIKRSFPTACRMAGIEDFRFHDLRHTCINNWRLQGHDFFRIMAASGHKTMSVFKRYNTVSEEELKSLVNPRMDTIMDTMAKNGLTENG